MIERYDRHIKLPFWGQKAQDNLQRSSVLVIGAGGLGSVVLPYLVSAGVGRVGILDYDTVSLSNLQRQVLYNEQDCGQSKAMVALKKMQALNSAVTLEAFNQVFDSSNAEALVSVFDLIIDCSDNFRTRYLINDACIRMGKPWVYGALFKYEGQLAVFNYQGGASYRCLFNDPPKTENLPNCSEVGVFSALVALIGSMQVAEALKILNQELNVLSSTLLSYNINTHRRTLTQILKNSESIAFVKAQQALVPISLNDCEFIARQLRLDDLNSTVKYLFVDIRAEEEVPKVEHPLVKQMSGAELASFVNSGFSSFDQQLVVFCATGKRARQWVQEHSNSPAFYLKEDLGDFINWLSNLTYE